MESELAQLRGLDLPPTPGFWPPAPGWWLMLGIVLLAALVWLWHRRRQQRQRMPYRQARIAVGYLVRAHQAGDITDHQFLDETNALLKRLCMHRLALDHAATLSGQDWLTFLDAQSRSEAFTRGAGQALGEARFQPRPTPDSDALQQAVDRLLYRWERA